MPEPTVAAGVVRGLMAFAVSKGANEPELAKRAGIDPRDLADQDARIPFEKYVGLMRAGKELANDPALALHFGEASDLAEMSIVGLIGQSCETVADGLAQINRYGRLVAELDPEETDRFVFQRRDGRMWMVDRRPNPNEFFEISESVFARFASSLHGLTGGSPIKAVHVTHPDPGYGDEYERVLGAPVTFESDWNAVAVEEALLSSRITLERTWPPYVFGVLSARADQLLRSLQKAQTVRGRVEALLIPILHTGEGGLDAIAAEFGMSRRTVQRRLQAEGVTFGIVLDELRCKMAVNYLSEERVSVNETAYLVGFSEPAAFSRAFKRWTGRSPSEFRSAQQGSSAPSLSGRPGSN